MLHTWMHMSVRSWIFWLLAGYCQCSNLFIQAESLQPGTTCASLHAVLSLPVPPICPKRLLCRQMCCVCVVGGITAVGKGVDVGVVFIICNANQSTAGGTCCMVKVKH